MARFHRTARVWAPWRLDVGDYVYVDEHVDLYNPFGITIGDRVIISRRSFLCTASHDYCMADYPLVGAPIEIDDDSWIAAEAFVGPGVRVGGGSVIAARAVVTKDVPAGCVAGGNPARVIKPRTIQETGECSETPEAV